VRSERLEDRIRILNAYPFDFLLLRYHLEGGASRAAAVSQVPVINAGDGVGQHPTQALLDLYTLWRELGRIDGLRVALVGDLRDSDRVAFLARQYVQRFGKSTRVGSGWLATPLWVPQPWPSNGSATTYRLELGDLARK